MDLTGIRANKAASSCMSVDEIGYQGDFPGFLDLPGKLTLVFRACAGTAPRQNFASVAHELAHQIDILVIDMNIEIFAEVAGLSFTRSETSSLLNSGAGAGISASSHGLDVSLSVMLFIRTF